MTEINAEPKHRVDVHWESPSCEALAAFQRTRRNFSGMRLPRHRQLVRGDLVTLNQSNGSIEISIGQVFPDGNFTGVQTLPEDVHVRIMYGRVDETQLVRPTEGQWIL